MRASKLKRFVVFLPSGCGTTCFYLAKHLPRDCRVLTCPTVSTQDHLKAQFQILSNMEAPSSLPFDFETKIEIIDTKEKFR